MSWKAAAQGGARVPRHGPARQHERRQSPRSERYDREMTDVWPSRTRSRGPIAGGLRVAVAGGSFQRPPARSTRGYAAYSRGPLLLCARTPDALMRSRTCSERAIALDRSRPLPTTPWRSCTGTLGSRRRPSARCVLAEHVACPPGPRTRRRAGADARAAGHAPQGARLQLAEVDRELQSGARAKRESALVRLRYAISGTPPPPNDEAMAELEVVLQSGPSLDSGALVDGSSGAPSRRPERTIAGAPHDRARPGALPGALALGIGLNDTGPSPMRSEPCAGRTGLSAASRSRSAFWRWCRVEPGCATTCSAARQADEMAAAGYVPPSTLCAARWARRLGWRIRVDGPGRSTPGTRSFMPIRSFPFLDSGPGDARFWAAAEECTWTSRGPTPGRYTTQPVFVELQQAAGLLVRHLVLAHRELGRPPAAC